MVPQSEIGNGKPTYVTDLEAAYGAPSEAGFGSAVFYEKTEAIDSLELTALSHYRYFVGDLWERYGEDAWMGPWNEVYARKAGANRDIVSELGSITDLMAKMSVPMVLDVVENAEAARQALSSAYDDAAVAQLAVYTVGDGAAMSGLLIAARRDTGEAIFLVFLMD